mgnify:CR=1 FL=1
MRCDESFGGSHVSRMLQQPSVARRVIKGSIAISGNNPEHAATVCEALGIEVPDFLALGPHDPVGNDLGLAARFSAGITTTNKCAGCGRCETDGEKFQCCDKCIAKQLVPARYCSRECQHKAWPEHRLWHKEQKRVEKEMMEQLRRPDMQAKDESAVSLTCEFARRGNVHSDQLARGLLYLGQQNYAKAVKALRKCLEQNPNCPEAHFNLGIAYERCNDLRQSTQMFLAAADYQDIDTVKWADSVSAGFEKLTYCLLAKMTMPKPAWWNDRDLRKLSKRVLKASPDGEGPLKMRAEALSCSGQFWDARGTTRSRAELEEAATLYQRLAKIAMGRGSRDAARTFVENGTGARQAALRVAESGPGAVAVLEFVDGLMHMMVMQGDDEHEEQMRRMPPAERRRATQLATKQHLEERRSQMTSDDLHKSFYFYESEDQIPPGAMKVIKIGASDRTPHGGFIARFADAPPSALLVE